MNFPFSFLMGSVIGVGLAHSLTIVRDTAAGSVAWQGCGCANACAPEDVGSGDLSGEQTVCFKTGQFSSDQRTWIIAGANVWDGSSVNVSFVPTEDPDPENNEDCDIAVWRAAIPGNDLAEASPFEGTVKIDSTFVSSTQNHWANLGLHEFGHLLGFGGDFGSQCISLTRMTGEIGWYWDASPSLAPLDYYAAQRNYLNYTDADCDGSFAVPGDDCDDTDSCVYSGAFDTNPYCDTEHIWPAWSDYNCDLINDVEQREQICAGGSPIVIDPSGDGITLTNRDNGVVFNINGAGAAEQIPWTAPRGDDAWLSLDRNGNGVIDDGTELFGNVTPQPASENRNGFLALAVFDGASAGGNGNGWIDAQDAIFVNLRLWHDGNQDGISQPSELRALAEAGLLRISLHYRELLRIDRWGNWFRYRARVLDGRNRDVGPWAYDVFFTEPPEVKKQRPGAGRGGRRQP